MRHFAKHLVVLLDRAPANLRAAIYFLALGLLYLLVARASLFFVYQPEGVASIWPPSGLALAALLLNRRRSWPVIISILFIANICANLLGNNPLLASLGFALANCAEATLIASLLVRFTLAAPDPSPQRPSGTPAELAGQVAGVETPLTFERVGPVLWFFGLFAIGNAFTALLGAATAALSFGVVFWRVWLTWWVSDGLGIVLITPLILVWLPGKHGIRWQPAQFVEGALLVSGVTIVSGYLFLNEQPWLADSVLGAYLLFPFLIWAGLRFSPRFVTSLLAFTSLIAILGTLNGLGQFAEPGQSPDQHLVGVQLYLGVLVFTTLLLSAMFKELKQTGERLARSETGYLNLFQNASIGIFHSRPRGNFIRVNPSLASMLGYASPREMVSTVTNIATQVYVDALNYQGVLDETLRQDGWTYAVNRYRRKDGSLMTGRLSVRKVSAADGDLAYLEGFVEDVTERMQVEMALRASEEKYRLLVENSHNIIYTLTADGVFTFVSPAWTALLGHPANQITGHSFQIFVHPDDVPGCMRWLQKVIETGQRQDGVEYRVRHTDGSWRWHTSSAVPLRDESGTIIGFEGIASDITERKQAEQIAQARLRLVEFSDTHNLDELLKAMLDEAEALTGSQISFFHFLEAGQTNLALQTWSTRTEQEFCKAQGKRAHDPVGQAGVWVDCIRERAPVIHNDYASLSHRSGLPEGHAALTREMVVPVLRGESIVCILGLGNKSQDYTQRDVSAVSQLADLTWDIAERKRAEQALKKSETLLNKTQELSKMGGWEYDTATKKMTWTREVYRIFGVSEDYNPDDIARDVSSYVPEDQQVIEQAFYQALNAGQPYDLELRFINLQGKHLWVRTQGTPVYADGKLVKVTGNIMDVNANKLAEEILRRLNKRLAQQLAENEALQTMLVEQATHDSLTGLYNRRFMDDVLQREFMRADREGYPVSVLMLDIDHFKNFNDSYGHEAGDQVLVALSSLLPVNIRQSDVACRFGGDEFVIILPGAGAADALHRAELIREEFASVRIGPEGFSATISVGLAVYPQHGGRVDELLRAADSAMYAAKDAGRNCVCVWGS